MRVAYLILPLLGIAGACTTFGSDGGSSPGDAPSDAGSGSDAPPSDAGPRACNASPGALFCDDFDDGRTDPRGDWGSVLGNTDGLAFTTKNVQSAPRAMAFSIDGGAARTGLAKGFTLTKSTITIEADFYVDADPASVEEVDPIQVNLSPLPPGADRHLVAVAQYSNVANFEYYYTLGDGGYDLVPAGIATAIRQWNHAEIVIKRDRTGATAEIKVNNLSSKTIPLVTNTVTDIELLAGQPEPHARNGAATVIVDNVVVSEQ